MRFLFTSVHCSGGVLPVVPTASWKATRRYSPRCEIGKVEIEDADSAEVETVKVPLLFPSSMVMLGSTLATFGLLLDKVTTTPLGGAGLLRVTVPSTVSPASTSLGSSVREGRVGSGPPVPPLRRAATRSAKAATSAITANHKPGFAHALPPPLPLPSGP